jgi:hypothetical protein
MVKRGRVRGAFLIDTAHPLDLDALCFFISHAEMPQLSAGSLEVSRSGAMV